MTEKTFKVGDTITLNARAGAKAVVEYGPYNTSPTYLVKLIEGEDAGDVFPALAYVMKAAPAFTDGDKVRVNDTEFSLHAGPFTSSYGDQFWVLERADGAHSWAREDALTVVTDLVPIGTRVRIDRAKWAEQTHGMTGVVESNTETWRAEDDDTHPYIVRIDNGSGPHVAELTPVDEPADTFEHNGIAYDLSMKYRDREGDVWRFARVDGVVRGDWGLHLRSISAEDSTLSYAVDHYGPLTKLTD
ncbi:phiSA1p31-related protein [Streptomyces scopuliridis]|uniref:phiSA1p31-related protein n=1 Tax=Streptomyces scopuliridis TaxID=452529 RepID=UPI0034497570